MRPASEIPRHRWWGVLSLLALAALLYRPGLSTVPVTDRDEARFAQATRQMLETGDFVNIRFQDQPRHKKPIGIHWLQAAAVTVAGGERDSIGAYRLPSAIGATFAVVATYLLGAGIVGPTAAWLGAALLAASVLLNVEAHIAKTDAALLAAIVVAQLALARVYIASAQDRPARMGWALVFWAALGVGALLKGPIPLLVAGTTALALAAWDRRWRWLGDLRPVVGATLFAAIVAPWLVAVQRATDGAFLREALGSDFFAKAAGGEESHGLPPGFYLLLVTVTFWPGSMLAGWALGESWRNRVEPAVRFLLAWLVPSWILFELVPTKLPHYVLPLYPALALLTAWALLRPGAVEAVRSLAARVGLVVWLLLTLAMGAAPAALAWAIGTTVGTAGVCVALAAAVVGGAAVAVAWRGRPARGAFVGVLGAVIVLGPVWVWELPDASSLWVSRRVAEVIERGGAAGVDPAQIVAAGFHEPSLVFELGTAIGLLAVPGAVDRLTTGGGVAIVEARADERFRTAARDAGLTLEPLGEVEGLNYSKGERVRIMLYMVGR